jgi:hypothetical protein
VSLNPNRPDSSTLPCERDTVAVHWFSLVSTFTRTQAEAVAAKLLREIEVLKLARSEECVPRTIAGCTNVAGVFVDEMDREAQDIVSNDAASP